MDIRIDDKQNGFVNGDEVTIFKVFKKDGGQYVFVGNYYVSGHNASDRDCENEYANCVGF